MMCSACMAEEYGYGNAPEMDSMKDCEFCKECDAMTMQQNKDRTRITDKLVIKYFECAKCGSEKKTKSKRWSRPKRKPNKRRK